MAVVLLLLILSPVRGVQENDEKALGRFHAILEKLASEEFEVREAATKDLLTLPARLSPEMAVQASRSNDAEVRSRLETVLIPEPWARVLPGTLGEARDTIAAIVKPGHHARTKTLETVLARLVGRPGDSTAAALLAILQLPEPGARDFALAGLCRVPAKDPAPLIPLLREPAFALRAADAIIAAGDPSVVPAAFDVFVSGSETIEGAGRVLRRFGIGDRIAALATAMRENPRLRSTGVNLLARMGSRAEGPLAELLPLLDSNQREVVRALSLVGSERSIAPVRAYFESNPDAEGRDRALFALRDPEWARERLAALRRDPALLAGVELDELAAAGGESLRRELLDWWASPDLKVSARQKLLPMLGAAARREDGPLLADRLGDARLRGQAAEALDRLGDPAHARALLRAYRTSLHPGPELARALLAMPSEDLEEDLLEILSDPGGHRGQASTALVLAGRRLSPRLRETLLAGLVGNDPAWSPLRGEALRLLAESLQPGDKPSIDALRAAKDAGSRVAGLLLALRSGEASVAPELAALLAGRENFNLQYPSSLLDSAAPAGPAWRQAVLESWKRSPQWTDGAVWLMRQGVREAQDALSQTFLGLDSVQRPRVEQALAAAGVADALDRIQTRLAQNRMSPEDEQAFLAAAGRARREQIIDAAFGKVQFPDSAVVRLAARMALPRGVPLYRDLLAHAATEGAASREQGTALCIRALAALKVVEAVDDLRQVLRSPNPATRAAAALALADLGDRGAVPLLVRLVDDPFEVPPEHPGRFPSEPQRRVWHAALESLEKITGVKSEGGSVADRRRFWRNRDGRK